MEASEEISPLYNIHFMKVFPLPSPAGGMLEVADVPDRHRAGGNMLFLNDFNLWGYFTLANSNRPCWYSHSPGDREHLCSASRVENPCPDF